MKPTTSPSDRLRLLRWTIPALLFALVAVYQLSVAHWIQTNWGESYHRLAELAFYGIGGPVLAFLVLDYLGRWQAERETSDLQSKILEEARTHLSISRGLNDEALQNLYAASILLDSLETNLQEDAPDMSESLQDARQSVEAAMHRLRVYLQSPENYQEPGGNGREHSTQRVLVK